MADRKVYGKVLWVIILLAVADIFFIISYKLHFISCLEDFITEDTAEMISTLTLTFLLIVMILSIPTGPVKGKRRKRVVEVAPLRNSDEVYFTPTREDNGPEEGAGPETVVEVEEYLSPSDTGNGVEAETSSEIDDDSTLTLISDLSGEASDE